MAFLLNLLYLAYSVVGISINLYTDTACKNQVGRLDGSHGGVCQSTLGSAAISFKVINLDSGCLVTLYPASNPPCPKENFGFAQEGKCYSNPSVAAYSIDLCDNEKTESGGTPAPAPAPAPPPAPETSKSAIQAGTPPGSSTPDTETPDTMLQDESSTEGESPLPDNTAKSLRPPDSPTKDTKPPTGTESSIGSGPTPGSSDKSPLESKGLDRSDAIAVGLGLGLGVTTIVIMILIWRYPRIRQALHIPQVLHIWQVFHISHDTSAAPQDLGLRN